MLKVKFKMKPEVREEINYFKEWFYKTTNYKTKRKLYLHCWKLAKNLNNYEWRL